MGILSFFRKKKEEDEFGGLPEDLKVPDFSKEESGLFPAEQPSPFPSASSSFQPSPIPSPAPSLQPQAFQQMQAPSSDKDLQIINAKLDTLKAMLETVMSKLERLEREKLIENKELKYPLRLKW